jgi:hypothetical protein
VSEHRVGDLQTGVFIAPHEFCDRRQIVSVERKEAVHASRKALEKAVQAVEPPPKQRGRLGDDWPAGEKRRPQRSESVTALPML